MDSMETRKGFSLAGWLLGALAIWVIGFIWYGFVFSDWWTASHGLTEASYEGKNTMTWMFTMGLLIPLAMSWGLGWLHRRMNIRGINAALGLGLGLALLFIIPQEAYNLTYHPSHNWTAFGINGAHGIVTMTVASAIHSLFGK